MHTTISFHRNRNKFTACNEFSTKLVKLYSHTHTHTNSQQKYNAKIIQSKLNWNVRHSWCFNLNYANWIRSASSSHVCDSVWNTNDCTEWKIISINIDFRSYLQFGWTFDRAFWICCREILIFSFLLSY